MTTPREAIAKALWLKGQRTHAEDWPRYLAWYENEVAHGRVDAADNSAIGQCLIKADRLLRLLHAAGIRAEMMDEPSPE